MSSINLTKAFSCSAFGLLFGAATCLGAPQTDEQLQALVTAAVTPVMQQQNIAGLAVALTINGQPHYFNYGVAAKDTGQKVSENTLFEVGSVSKTFTATLAGYAQATGKLDLSTKASTLWPELKDSAFDNISVLQLGTYSGGDCRCNFPLTRIRRTRCSATTSGGNPRIRRAAIACIPTPASVCSAI